METLLLSSTNTNALELSVELINKGEIIVVPTETVYGLVCDWNNSKAIENIYKLKGRDFNKPLSAFCDGMSMILAMVDEINENSRKLIENFMPGPITLLMKRNKRFVDYSNNDTDIIGIRIPDNEFVLSMIKKIKRPLASTSANISGNSPLSKVGDLYKFFKGKIPLIIDGGRAKIGIVSTIVDVVDEPPKIVREGALTKEQIWRVLKG